MAVKPKSIGPWGGCDNFNDLDSNVFQPPSSDPRRRDPPPRLAVGENVDLDVDGWPQVRAGLTELTAVTAGRQLFPTERESLLLFQDGASIYTYDPAEDASVEIVTGLNPDSVVQFCAHADQVFYTNGTVLGRIAGGAATNWGCSVGPTPSIAAASGSLLVGRYHVSLEPIDANGIRHAAALSGVYDLASPGALRVSVTGVDSAATHLRIYVAGPDDDVLYLLGDVAVGSFPYDVTALPAEDTTCKTIGLDPPTPHNFAFSYQNHLMLVAGSVVYPSLSAAAHLYDLHRHQVGRPETVLAGAGLVDGFWTVSASGAYWATGETPEQWRQWSLKHPCEFCSGSLTINSSALPFLGIESAQPIVLFMSSWGLAVGMSGGVMMFPFRDQKTEDVTNKRVHFGFVKKGGYRQLAYMLSLFLVQGIAAPGPGTTAAGFTGAGSLSATGSISNNGVAEPGPGTTVAGFGASAGALSASGAATGEITGVAAFSAEAGVLNAEGDFCDYSEVTSTLVVASADAYFGDTNPNNTKHTWTNTGPRFRLESITIDHTNIYMSGGSCMEELFVQAFWGNIDVDGSASDSWPVDPDASFSDCGTGGACGNETDFGAHQVVMNIAGLVGDHLVETGDTLEFNWWDNFNDCGGDYEARLEGVTFTVVGEEVCGSLFLTDMDGDCPLSGDYSIGSPSTYYLTSGTSPLSAGDWTLRGNGNWPGGSVIGYDAFTYAVTTADPKITLVSAADEGASLAPYISAKIYAPSGGAVFTVSYNATFDSTDGLVEAFIYNSTGGTQASLVLAYKSNDDPTVTVVPGIFSAAVPPGSYLLVSVRQSPMFPLAGAPLALTVDLTCDTIYGTAGFGSEAGALIASE